MTKNMLAAAIALAVTLAGPRVARAGADESQAKEIAQLEVGILDEAAKAFSQLRAFLPDESKSCAVAHKDASNDLDLRLRHIKELKAKLKDLRSRADADTIAEAEKQAKADREAALQKMRTPETQKVLKRFQQRCPSEAATLKVKWGQLPQAE